ncbi:MAG TPA: molybdopterin-dependent oxidoreductase [Myxococcota bacterium]|nr:molybdopterin-dependent oxidoreductase [Myxococcota bacterium]
MAGSDTSEFEAEERARAGERRVVHRVCPFCEATCGLAVEVRGDEIVSVRGDAEDPFSRGFICPKAHGLKELHHDRERLRRPVRRTPIGWEEISWDEAYREVASRLLAVRERHGNDAIGVYSGNPVVHDLGAVLYRPVLLRTLGTRSLFNSAAIDTLPKIVQTGLMFGRQFPTGVPVPDIDRTHYLLVIGANPAVSHGSLMTMPDAPRRLKGVAKRGKLVVVDPRRSETARLASEHHFIRPGTDAAFLLALVHALFEQDRVTLGAAAGRVDGLGRVEQIAKEFAPEAVADFCGISADAIRRIAREMAAAESAACYGRLGTCVQEFGTLATWGCDLVNILTGNLDRPGGVMFPAPAAPVDAALPKGPFQMGRWHSRVGGQPEVEGQIPSSTQAEEMLTPGEGQVRAMITLMTNPVRSAANSAQLEQAYSQLEFFVAIDFYINETTRHAHIILPTPSPSELSGYELPLYHLSVRNVAKWSNAVIPAAPDRPETWQVFSALAARLMGLAHLTPEAVDDLVFGFFAKGVLDGACRYPDLTLEEMKSKLEGESGPTRIVDMLLRVGPQGDGFGRRPGGLTLAGVRAAAHGIDLGPLEPRLAEIVRTESGRIELAPERIVADVARLRERMASPRTEMLLIGRRDMRCSNSFMHNLPSLVKGRDRCTLQISVADARRIGLVPGDRARVTSRTGSVVAPIEVSDDLMPGVVSLPHGWGHDDADTRQSVAKAHPGVNANALTDDQAYDAASGTAVLFGTPVRVEPEAALVSGRA